MIADEKYEFKSATKTKILILGVVGILLFIIGVFQARSGGGHEEHEKKAATEISKSLTASVAPQEEEHEGHKAEGTAEHGEHHGSATWVKRIEASLWHNNVFFTGLGIIGLFFVAIQYAAQAGWSAPIKRIPLAMGSWIPFAGILMVVLWFVSKGDLFHWTHADLFDPKSPDYDKAIVGKGGFFYWPLAGGTFPILFIGRMILFFGLWYWFLILIKREMLAEDVDGDTQHWYKSRKFSAIFLVIFAVSSSIAAWDWIMSIDAHWFSTMFGWYTFAGWWETGLAAITLIVVSLRNAGYLKVVNANHMHDLGKFVFAFSIFWTYIWFGQFLLIYYANIPEETIYFVTRMKTAPYNWIFYASLFLNFVLPFLLLMPRESKRFGSTLQLVCTIVIIGQWFNFYNMVIPGIMKGEGGVGFLEIGLALVFAAVYLFVVLSSLSKMQLVAKHHPFMEESLNHHI